jgi:hypothetical protein
VRSLNEGPANESASGEMSEATLSSAAAMRCGRCERAAMRRSCYSGSTAVGTAPRSLTNPEISR